MRERKPGISSRRYGLGKPLHAEPSRRRLGPVSAADTASRVPGQGVIDIFAHASLSKRVLEIVSEVT